MRLEVIPWNGGPPPTEDALREQLTDDGFDVFRWRDEAGTTTNRTHTTTTKACGWSKVR